MMIIMTIISINIVLSNDDNGPRSKTRSGSAEAAAGPPSPAQGRLREGVLMN